MGWKALRMFGADATALEQLTINDMGQLIGEGITALSESHQPPQRRTGFDASLVVPIPSLNAPTWKRLGWTSNERGTGLVVAPGRPPLCAELGDAWKDVKPTELLRECLLAGLRARQSASRSDAAETVAPSPRARPPVDPHAGVVQTPLTSGYRELRYVGQREVTVPISGLFGGNQEITLRPDDVRSFLDHDAAALLAAAPDSFEYVRRYELRPTKHRT